MAETLSYSAELADAITPVLERIIEAINSLSQITISASMNMSDNFAMLDESIQAVDTSIEGLAGISEQAVGVMDDMSLTLDEQSNLIMDNTAAIDENTAAKEGNAESDVAVADSSSMAGGGLMGMGMIAGMVSGLFFKMGLDTDAALTRVMALAGIGSDQMGNLRDAIDNMATEVGKASSDLANGLYDVVSAGFTKTSDAMFILHDAAELAAIGEVDLHTVTNGLTAIMKDYGYTAQDATKVTEYLLEGVRDGKSSFEDYSNAIGLVAETAHSAGFSLQEATAALSTLTIVFPDARRAGMDLQNLLRHIGVDSEAVGKAAEKMGLSFDQAKFDSMSLGDRLLYLQQITGGNQAELLKLTGGAAGFAAAQQLLNGNMSDYKRILGDVTNSSGVLANAWETHEGSISAHIEHLGGSLSVLADRLTSLAAPVVNTVLDDLAGLFNMLGQAIETHGNIIIPILGALAIVIGSVLVAALWSMAAAAGAALAALLPIAAPIAGIALLLGGLALGFKAAYDHSAPFRQAVDGVRDAMGQLWNKLQPIVHDALPPLKQLLQDAQQKFSDLWQTIQPYVTGGLDGLKGLLGDVSGALQSLDGWLTPTSGGFKQVGDMVLYVHGQASGFQQTLNTIGTILGNIGGAFTNLWNAVQPVVDDLSGFASTVGTVLEPVLNDLGQVLGTLWSQIESDFIPVWQQLVDTYNQSLKPAFNGLMQALKPLLPVFEGLGIVVGGMLVVALGLLMGILSGLAGMLSQILQGVTRFVGGFVEFFSGMVQTVVGIVVGFGQTLSDLFSGHWNKIGDDLKTAWDNITTGLHNAFKGLIDMATGILQAGFGSLKGLVDGFVQGFVGFFKDLYDKIVGHSIWKDLFHDMTQMLTGWVTNTPGQLWDGLLKLINHFGQLKDQALAKVNDMFNQLKNLLGNSLPGQALIWAEDMLGQFMNGIYNGTSWVMNAIMNLVHNITKSLGFSLPTEGPLSKSDQWMPDMMQMLADGIGANSHKVGDAAKKAAGVISSNLQGQIGVTGTTAGLTVSAGPPLISGSGTSLGQNNPNQAITINLQGGIGQGLAMMNPADRNLLMRQISKEIGMIVHLQSKSPVGYTGS